MEVETEQVKESNTPSPPSLPAEDQGTNEVDAKTPPVATSGKQRSVERGSPNSSVKRNGSLRRDGFSRKGSLRRDQRTGEKRRSRTGSLSSLVGYEAKYPVSPVPVLRVFFECGARWAG